MESGCIFLWELQIRKEKRQVLSHERGVVEDEIIEEFFRRRKRKVL